MIKREVLEKLYIEDRLSMLDIAKALSCSQNKVVYWMNHHKIARRSISDAVYQKNHPGGEPFTVKPIRTKAEANLHGIGIGLYWGEGTKANRYSVRLGNTDPALLRTFMQFLIELYGVAVDDFRFGLQIFTDIDPQQALRYWTQELHVKTSQFYKITVTISGSLGTYRRKSPYGVVTVYYHNKKLRDILVGLLPR